MLLVVALATSVVGRSEDRCTSIIVGKSATGEGGPLTSHTVDCAACDFRLSKVPSRKIVAGSTRPVYRYRAEYPRWVGEGKGSTYEMGQLTSYNPKWSPRIGDFAAIGEIPEATKLESTYAYVDGAYGVMNEAGLVIGESTCAAELIAKPVCDEGGTALLDVRELSLVAMERCATAVCAVETMGTLAETYGYYGADASHVEAGEALTIVDRDDAWVFHVLADDTGTSAVWAAKRVNADEVAVVANQFIIGDVPATSSLDNGFAFSSNVRVVAARAGLWANGEPLHFTRTFGQSRGLLAPYATRRQWRVFSVALGFADLGTTTPPQRTQASPQLLKDPDVVDEWGYDFSVKIPPNLWHFGAKAVMDMLRDHYENTRFDMTKGPASGPYGDPARFDPGDNRGIFGEDGVSTATASTEGRFERAISLFRCAYSFVSQPRLIAGDAQVPPMVWLAQYAPHSASYVPVFAEAKEVPSALAVGSLHEVDAEAQYWCHALVGNWAGRFYVAAMPYVAQTRDDLDAQTRFDLVQFLETEPLSPQQLGDFAEEAAKRAVDEWWTLFWDLAAFIKDGQRIDDIHADKLNPTHLFYRSSWLKQTNFYFADQQGPTRLFYVPDPHEAHDWFRALSPTYQLSITFGTGIFVGLIVASLCCFPTRR